jgi:hypothetical protein
MLAISRVFVNILLCLAVRQFHTSLFLLLAASAAAATAISVDAASYLDSRPLVHEVINGQARAAVPGQLTSSRGKELRKEFGCYEIPSPYCGSVPDVFRYVSHQAAG